MSRYKISHTSSGWFGACGEGNGVPVNVLEKVNGWTECMERVFWL
jgi:hypothetical protein